MDDLISRRAAIESLQNHYEVRNPKQNAIMDECVMLISNVPSVQTEKMQLSKEDATKGTTFDCISRQAAINEMKDMYAAAEKWAQDAKDDETRARAESCMATNVELKLRVEKLPSAQPERMTNRQWVDFLSAQFDISRTSAKEMLHGMMRWKKEDNFKKMFNGGGEQDGQTNR